MMASNISTDDVMTATVTPVSIVENKADFMMRVVYICFGVIGITGNTLVIATIAKFPRMRERLTNKFILNQSSIDLTTSVLLIAMNLSDNVDIKNWHITSAEVYCRVWMSRLFQWASFLSSSYNLVFMTYERFFAIVYPIRHATMFNNRIAYILMASTWAVGLGYYSAYIISTSGIKPGNLCTLYSEFASKFWMDFVSVFTVAFEFLLPVLLMAFAYIRIYITLRRESHSSVSGAGNTGRDVMLARARRNTIKMMLSVSMAFVFCWSWVEVIYLLWTFGYDKIDFTHPLYHFAVAMVTGNCAINPIIYSIQYESFQSNLRRLLCCTTNKQKYKSSATGTSSDNSKDTKMSTMSNLTDSVASGGAV